MIYARFGRGTKAKPSAVGDIVFNDGSAIEYTSDLTEEQKKAAIAVIFYVGSADNVLGDRILGVGLQEAEKKWALAGTTGASTNFYKIACTKYSSAPSESYYSYTWIGASSSGTSSEETDWITGDFDGSDNWAEICKKDSTAEADPSNYPAFEWANNFGSGWYLPTIVEMYEIHKNLTTVNDAIKTVGGTIVSSTGDYTSSSQKSDTAEKFIYLQRAGTNTMGYYAEKTSEKLTRAIRKF